MSESQNVTRDKAGRFLPGVSGNPKGGYPSRGKQRYSDRVELLLETYKTTGEILGIAGDPKRLNKLPVRDAQIIVHLARTLTGDDIRGEREALLDRLEGRPKNQDDGGEKDTSTVQERAKWLLANGLATANLLKLCQRLGIEAPTIENGDAGKR